MMLRLLELLCVTLHCLATANRATTPMILPATAAIVPKLEPGDGAGEAVLEEDAALSGKLTAVIRSVSPAPVTDESDVKAMRMRPLAANAALPHEEPLYVVREAPKLELVPRS
jgi:hypothetical protein